MLVATVTGGRLCAAQRMPAGGSAGAAEVVREVVVEWAALTPIGAALICRLAVARAWHRVGSPSRWAGRPW